MKSLVVCSMILLIASVLPALSDCEVTVVPSNSHYGDGDIMALDVRVINSATDQTLDLYVCLEILGAFYFYPSFSSTDLDFRSFNLIPGQEITEIVIPPVVLPENLPNLICNVYAAAFAPGTWDLVSNVGFDTIRMSSSWEQLPLPTYENTFYFVPGVEGLVSSSSQTHFDQVAQDIFTHFDFPGIYARRGVTILDSLFDDQTESEAVIAAQKAESAGLVIGFHMGVTCHHTFGDLDVLRQSDRRFNQWESNGTVYSSGDYDLATLTVSRYAQPVVEFRKNRAMSYGRGFLGALNQYPDTVVCANGPIEVELRRAFNDQPHYADYSPFMVMEFRDWLTHKNDYNDQTGRFAGQGFPHELLNQSDFSNDLSPDLSHSGSQSFNESFGTDFATWNLRYWDPDEYPDALPMDADPQPQAGLPGHISSGFDPPRDYDGILVGGNDLFKKVWDGWRSNFHYDHRVGYGFRQAAVQSYVSDNSQWLLAGGVPIERNFTHQIPVDFLGNWIRERGSASPFWTALNPYSNAGYTAYFETALREDLFVITRMLSPRWGLFEYHPAPFADQPLEFYSLALESIYQHRCQILVPIELYADEDGNYRLIGSHFETAMNSFFNSAWPETDHRRFDQPYFNDVWVDYLPPPVRSVSFSAGTLSWDPIIWSSRSDILWTDWSNFDYFAIHKGSAADFVPNPSNKISTTRSPQIAGLESGFYKVLAVTKSGLTMM